MLPPPRLLTTDRFIDQLTVVLDQPTGGLHATLARTYTEMAVELDRKELELVRGQVTASWIGLARALQGLE